MTKKITAIFMAIIVLVSIAGCSKKNEDSGRVLSGSFEEVFENIKNDVEMPSMMNIRGEEGEQMLGMPADDYLKENFNLDAADYNDYFVSFSPINVQSDTLAMFEVKDKENIEKTKEGIKTFLESKKAGFYLPDQMEAYENAYIESYDDKYVVLFMSPSVDDIKTSFEKNLKDAK